MVVYDIDAVSLSSACDCRGKWSMNPDIPLNLNGEEALKLKESADALKKIIDSIEL